MRRVDFPRCPRPRPPLCRPQHRPSPNRQAQEVSTQSSNQSINHPTKQSINQPTNQAVNQSINQPIGQSSNQSINEDAESRLLNFFCYSFRLHDSEETFPPRRRGELQRSLPYLHVHGRVSDLQNQPEGLPVGKVISGQRSALLGGLVPRFTRIMQSQKSCRFLSLFNHVCYFDFLFQKRRQFLPSHD